MRTAKKPRYLVGWVVLGVLTATTLLAYHPPPPPPPPPPPCTTNWCEVVQEPTGTIAYTNVNIWPDTNICLGTSIYAYPEANETCSDVVTRSVWAPASTNCPTTYSTNLSCPYYVTNWYVVSGPGSYSESGGGYGPFGIVITPTNCGSGTVTFHAQWKNTDPCTGEPTGGGTTSKSISFKVTHVDIAETDKITCACETTSFSLTNTCGEVTWEIITNGMPGEPTISGGTVTAGTNCGSWTVVARSVENTNCADYATVTVVRVTGFSGMTGNLVSTNPDTYVVCPVPTNSEPPLPGHLRRHPPQPGGNQSARVRAGERWHGDDQQTVPPGGLAATSDHHNHRHRWLLQRNRGHHRAGHQPAFA